MNIAELLSDVANAIRTAGLRKEVFELLQTKIELLREKLTELETENSELRASLARAERKNRDTPKPPLDDDAIVVLKLFYDSNGRCLHAHEVAAELRIQPTLAEYYFDILRDARLIIMRYPDDQAYELTPAGRAYLVEKGLVLIPVLQVKRKG